MIGAGASGFQIAPTIAPEVEHLTVFQRTAQWMFPNPNYHEQVGPGVRWALRHLPFYGRWYRFLIFWPGCDKGLEAARVDPDYPDQQTAVSEMNDLTRQMFTDWIVSQVDDDPELIAKVVPDYPATGKRTLQDNGSWLRTLTRDNVDLVRTGIDHIEADAVVTEDGVRHEADVLVLATGFQATKVLFPMEIRGRDGEDLRAMWGERPAAYLGITVPGFPNFFCMYGPGTNLAHGGSLIFHSECQMRYITQCIEALIEQGHRTMEPRRDRYEDWHERSQREMRGLVWSQPSIKHSFFKNAYGEIHGLSPWRLVDYWTWTRTLDPDDFVVRLIAARSVAGEPQADEAVRVVDDVDLRHAVVDDGEHHQRDRPIVVLDVHAGGAVDEHRVQGRVGVREADRLTRDHLGAAEDLALAVGPEHDLGVEDGDERVEVAATCRGVEGVHDVPASGAVTRRRRRVLHAPAGAARELTGRVGRALEHHRDLVERHREHVVEDEREALGRAQGLEHHEHREADRVGELGLVGGVAVVTDDDRVGNAHVERLLGSRPASAQDVETHAGRDRREPPADVVDRGHVGAARRGSTSPGPRPPRRGATRACGTPRASGARGGARSRRRTAHPMPSGSSARRVTTAPRRPPAAWRRSVGSRR